MEQSDIPRPMTPVTNTASEDQIFIQEEFSENSPDNIVEGHFNTQPSTPANPEVHYDEVGFKIPQL